MHNDVFLYTDAPARDTAQLRESVENSNFTLFTFVSGEMQSFWSPYSSLIFPLVPQETMADTVLDALQRDCKPKKENKQLASLL